MRRRGDRIVLVLALLMVLCVPRGTSACGPFLPYAVFVNTMHPDIPFGPYAAGELGVLQPTYARSYLAVAYRSMTGPGFNADEQKELVRVWDDRLYWACYKDRKGGPLQQWLDLRATVTTAGQAPTSIEVFKEAGYVSYVNCNDGAFKTAVETLKARIAKYGPTSPQVAEWVAQQDVVFGNCSGGPLVPAPAPAGASPEQKADRAYQRAAAQFYAGQYDEAIRSFSDIAKDPASPWQGLAPYLAARCLVRKGDLAQAESALEAVLADAKLKLVQPDAQRLLNLVRLQLRPEERLAELERSLARPDGQATLYQDLWDYTVLLDKMEGGGQSEAPTQEGVAQKVPPIAWKPGEMTDWITCFEKAAPEAARHAVDRWKQTKSLPWLVAAITKADKGTPELPDLMKAAAQVPARSPAFASLAFHRARFLIVTGKTQDARTLLNDALAQKSPGLPKSATNLLTSLRMQLDESLEAFLADAPRMPAAVCRGEGYGDIPLDYECGDRTEKNEYAGKALFDADSAKILNGQIPLETLAAIAKKSSLPAELRSRVAASAFVRAVLLERPEIAAPLAPTVSELLPSTARFMKRYGELATAEDRACYATYLLLALPGLEPLARADIGRGEPPEELDSFRDNWWCAEEVATKGQGDSEGSGLQETTKVPYDYQALASPPFVTPEMAKKGGEESAAIQKMGAGAVALCKRVLDWAQKRPDDPLVPEALHNAVLATKIGACKDDGFTVYSKQVFNLLHKKYPNSEWAKKTPYYY